MAFNAVWYELSMTVCHLVFLYYRLSDILALMRSRPLKERQIMGVSLAIRSDPSHFKNTKQLK